MKIKINNLSFEVEMIEGDIPKMNPNEECINLGLTEMVEEKISIRKGMTKQLTRTTVIHELVHAFIFSFGYTIENEEALCCFIGSQIDEILRLTDKIMNNFYEK